MQHLKETALKFTLKGVLTSAYKQRIGKRDAGSPDLAKLIENCFKHSQVGASSAMPVFHGAQAPSPVWWRRGPLSSPFLHPAAPSLSLVVQASPPEWDVFGADAHQRNHTNKGPSLESKVRGFHIGRGHSRNERA
eukprot:4907200-Prymnesium_polylepis.1